MIFFWVVVSIISGLYFVKAYSNPFFLILYVLFLAYIFKKFYGKMNNLLTKTIALNKAIEWIKQNSQDKNIDIFIKKNKKNWFKLVNQTNQKRK